MTFNVNILDDSTLWVAISFIVFLILVYGPLKKMIIDSLDKKILELKSHLDDSKKLKKEAEELFNEHILKDKENQKRIENLKTQAKTESLKIKEKIEDCLPKYCTKNNICHSYNKSNCTYKNATHKSRNEKCS